VGREVAAALSDIKDKVMIVASSDMTHYESQPEAFRKDHEAIKAILELDEEKLFQRVKSLKISMCGYAPTVAMISAAKALGAKNAKLIKYQTSGDVTDDMESVVGYAGIIIY
jgi:AmmeMemoRadiSam system protein B